jgi:hypothetical protein
MDKIQIQKKLLAVLMESPLYFTIPLKRRLEFVKLFSQRFDNNSILKIAATVADSIYDLTEGSMAGR